MGYLKLQKRQLGVEERTAHPDLIRYPSMSINTITEKDEFKDTNGNLSQRLVKMQYFSPEYGRR